MPVMLSQVHLEFQRIMYRVSVYGTATYVIYGVIGSEMDRGLHVTKRYILRTILPAMSLPFWREGMSDRDPATFERLPCSKYIARFARRRGSYRDLVGNHHVGAGRTHLKVAERVILQSELAQTLDALRALARAAGRHRDIGR